MIKQTLMLLVLSVCLLGNTADAKSKKSKKSQKSDNNGIPAQIAALQSQLDALMDLVAVADEATAIVDCDAGDLAFGPGTDSQTLGRAILVATSQRTCYFCNVPT